MEQYKRLSSLRKPREAADIRRAGIAVRMFRRIRFDRVNWPTSSFPIGTFYMSPTSVTDYIWRSLLRAVHPLPPGEVSRSLLLKRRTRRWRRLAKYDS